MKKSPLKIVGKVLAFLGLGIGGVISLVYFITNARLLFSGDYSIYSSPAGGFFNVLFSVLMYLFIIASVVISYLYMCKKNPGFRTLYYIFSLGLLLVAVLYLILNKLSFSSGLEGYASMALKLGLVIGLVGNLLIFIDEKMINKTNK